MRVVVDTNVVFRAFLSRESPIWRDLFKPATPIAFFSPRFLSGEIEEHWDRICTKSRMEAEDLAAARDEIFRLLTFVDTEEISPAHRTEAYELCRDIDPKDTPFVALAIHLRALLWSYDKELREGLSPKGFTTFYEPRISTQTMVDYLREARSITGQTFVRDSHVDPDGDAVIVFFHDFDEYRQDRPTSRITESMFEQYFASGDRIHKTLLLDSVRILRNLPALRSIEIVVPFDGAVYSVELTRVETEEYFGIDLLELAYDPSKWVRFASDFGYDADQQQGFFRRFGQRRKS